jgi:hypothetical protein
MKILKYTLIAVAVGMTLTTMAILMTPDKPCPELRAEAFSVSSDHLSDMLAKARRISVNGQCAQSGQHTRDGRFLILTVSGPDGRNSQFHEFTAAELKQ